MGCMGLRTTTQVETSDFWAKEVKQKKLARELLMAHLIIRRQLIGMLLKTHQVQTASTHQHAHDSPLKNRLHISLLMTPP